MSADPDGTPLYGSGDQFFRAILDWSIGDDATRYLFAEWLLERGDLRSHGYRWLGSRRKEPSRASSSWDWWHERSANRREIVLPDRVWRQLNAPPVDNFPNSKEFATLVAAEEAVCFAILSLQGEESAAT